MKPWIINSNEYYQLRKQFEENLLCIYLTAVSVTVH